MNFFDFIYAFTFFVYIYPFVMSLFWIAFAMRFFIDYASFDKKQKQEEWHRKLFPMVSILIPCYNEQETIYDTVKNLHTDLKYPHYEIICIDDGSTDNTWEVLAGMRKSGEMPKLRIIKLVNNAGKAHALTQGAIAARGEFLMGLDADSFLEHDAIDHLIANILGYKNKLTNFLGQRKGVGAVTGNPIVRNRSTLLAKIQLVEYASIVGLIKRSQRLFGRIGTVSGVCVLFRKRALMDVGWWDQDMITEDIAVTWKLQLEGWEAYFEPKSICWMLVPETVKGLYNQRIRWAQGGLEVMLRYFKVLFQPKKWSQLPLLVELILSFLWSCMWYISMGIFLYIWFVSGHINWVFFALGALLVLICMVQMIVALRVAKKYDPTAGDYFLWAAWYPFIYWFINPLTIVLAFPKAVYARIKGGQATWTSPDRGLKEQPSNSSQQL